MEKDIKAPGEMSAVPTVTFNVTRGGKQMPGMIPQGTTLREAFQVGGQTARLQVVRGDGRVLLDQPIMPVRDADGTVIQDATYLLALAPEAVSVPHEPGKESGGEQGAV